MVRVEVARASPVDGNRIVAAPTSRELGGAADRKTGAAGDAPAVALHPARNTNWCRPLGSSGSPAQMSCGTWTPALVRTETGFVWLNALQYLSDGAFNFRY